MRIIPQLKECRPSSALDSEFYIYSGNFMGVAPEFLLLLVSHRIKPKSLFYPCNFLLPFVVFVSLHM